MTLGPLPKSSNHSRTSKC